MTPDFFQNISSTDLFPLSNAYHDNLPAQPVIAISACNCTLRLFFYFSPLVRPAPISWAPFASALLEQTAKLDTVERRVCKLQKENRKKYKRFVYHESSVQAGKGCLRMSYNLRGEWALKAPVGCWAEFACAGKLLAELLSL